VGGTFRSLRGYNYRVWAAGALTSNTGTWMQRTAQDWLVLTQLTHNNATALGVVVALQFAPQVLLLPVTGFAADHFSRRKLLIATQVAMGALALGLGLLTLAGRVQLWHVYVFAFVLGCVTAFDSPARQTFVSELVGEVDLPNAVALNSASFNVARMVGPAVAGILIGVLGSGMLFVINAASFVAVIISLLLLRAGDLHLSSRAPRTQGGLADGFRYVWKRADLKAIHVMFLLIGTFCLNFAIFISTMSVSVFHVGAGQYGVLTSLMALGSVGGALLAAGRAKPHAAALFTAAVVLGCSFALAAFMPGYWLFGLMLVVMGASSQNFNTISISTVQLTTEPAMRGRVMAILLAMAMGGTPLGAPILGWVADAFGPRWSLGVGALAAFAAAGVGIAYFARYRARQIIPRVTTGE
jgi:MFS family permease